MKALKKIICFLLVAVIVSTTTASAATFINPSNTSKKRPDPFVQYHDGYYYAMWTIDANITLNRCKTLKGLAAGGSDVESKVLYKNGMSNFNSDFYYSFWAPEFHQDASTGKWYIYSSACKQGANGNGSTLFCLESVGTELWGSYNFKASLAVPNTSWQIDPSLYKAPNGQLYMTFVSGNGTNDLYVVKMKNYYTLDSSTTTKVATATYPWELVSNKVNEGGEFLEANGKLYLAYSANDASKKEYCMGLLRFTGNYRTDNLCDASKWVKYSEPFFKGGNGVYCTGHNSFFTAPDGKIYTAYHSRVSDLDNAKWPRFLCFQPVEFDANGVPKLNQVPSIVQSEPGTTDTYTYTRHFMDESAVLNHYSISTTEFDNGHGIAANLQRSKLDANINFAQTYDDMTDTGFHDITNTPFVALTVKAPADGVYGVRVQYNLDHTAALSKTKPYYMVIGVNDTQFYKGPEHAETTGDFYDPDATYNTRGFFRDTYQVYLKKGVNVLRVLPVVPEVAKTFTSWINVRYAEVDSRVTVLKNTQYHDWYVERDSITAYNYYTKESWAMAGVNPYPAMEAGINYETCDSYATFEKYLPYVAMDFYAPYTGYYDMNLNVTCQYGNHIGYYIVYIDKTTKYKQKLYGAGEPQNTKLSGIYLTKGTHNIAVSSLLGYSSSDYVNGYADWSDYHSMYYRYWDDKSYTVTLNNQSATTAGTTSVTTAYGDYLPSITVPKRTGYTFKGYYSQTGGAGTKYYNANGTYARSYNKTSNTTLYAYWVANKYTITAASSSTAKGTVSGSGSYTYATNATLTATPKVGYHFVNWTNSSGTVVSTSATYKPKVGASAQTYTANFTENTDTKYIVCHWKQNESGKASVKDSKNYTCVEKVDYTGTTNATVTPATKTFVGYFSPEAVSATISPDGTLVIDYYYFFKYGDADGNDSVDANDVALLKKFLIGADGNIDEKMADINGDGVIDLRDLLRLKLYLADNTVKIGT